jgi:hypothetical protein
MDTRNPYAPTRASLNESPASGVVGDESGIWREGSTLVMTTWATMPGRCIRCNEPALEPTRARTVYWHHPAIYLLVVGYGLLYIIVALFARKSATIAPGLCAPHNDRRRLAILISWVGVILGFTVIFFGAQTAHADLYVIGGITLFLAAIIGGIIFGRLVNTRKIDDRHIRLGGCGKPFLDSFPNGRP